MPSDEGVDGGLASFGSVIEGQWRTRYDFIAMIRNFEEATKGTAEVEFPACYFLAV